MIGHDTDSKKAKSLQKYYFQWRTESGDRGRGVRKVRVDSTKDYFIPVHTN